MIFTGQKPKNDDLLNFRLRRQSLLSQRTPFSDLTTIRTIPSSF